MKRIVTVCCYIGFIANTIVAYAVTFLGIVCGVWGTALHQTDAKLMSLFLLFVGSCMMLIGYKSYYGGKP